MAIEPNSYSFKMRFVSVALVTTFIVGTIAGPWQPRSDTQCATVCTENTKFNYDIGKTYVYDYDANTANSLQDGKESSRLRIRAKVEIQPVSKCDFAMRLLDVSLGNSESSIIIGSDEFKLALERYPLRFGYQDGHIEDLCPEQNEPTWVLNIKRGILSTFQNTMENLEKDHSHEETDITGKCKTNYKVLGGGIFSQATIQKTKDLTDCSDRSDVYTALQSSPLQEQSAFGPSTPVIKSSHECQHQVQDGKLHKSQCTEEHAFQPFSRQSSGAVTRNTQTLTYVSEKPTTFSNNDYIPTHKSLLYDHTDRRQRIDQSEVEESLKELCTVAENDIRPQVPHLFSKFVQKLQQLNYDQLYTIYKNIDKICDSSSKARKFLLDAIPLTGSEAGIILMKDMILTQNVLDTEADAWFLMLGFTPKPTKTMIEILMPLLETSSQYPKALLGISALVHSYCKDNSKCGHEQEIKNFLKVLSSKLGNSCHTNNNEDKEVVILSLKALGNVGHIGDLVPVVKQCYTSEDNSMEVRLAAIDAFRRLPCIYNRDELLQTFFNVEEDSEVRIGSYLAAMKCPTADMLAKVRESLDQEQINQVGSFVWTHLTNHQETSHPYKHNILKILSSKKLQKKFSTDVRKFSRYYEGSLYVDALRTGMHLDGSVVFSSKSYLPRSSALGLTLELFGETVDLFEVGGRVEGFEFLVESFFGPRGYFPDDTIQKILESSREQESYSQSKLNEIAKIFNLKNTYGDDPRGSFYMRVFGNDLHYTQFQGIEQLIQSSQRFSIIDALLKLARSEESEYTKSFMFMDSSVIIPTSVGLPLNLTLNGTAVVNLRIGGKIDLSRLASKSLDVRTHIEPSAAVEISGSMITDAFVTRSGLKIMATLHTSTYSDAAISVENGQVVKAQINMPKDQMEIFDIQSKVIAVNGCEETEHAPLTDDSVQMETCTGNGMSKYLGLQLCSHLQYPVMSVTTEENPSWLLAGPFSANIYLHKTDKGLRSYNFEYRWDKQTVTAESGKTLAIRTGRLSLDTPGSNVDRELTAEFVHDESQKSLAIRLASPVKKMTMNGKIVNENGLKQLDVKWIVDETERFALETELTVDTTKGNHRLSPSLNVRYYGKPVMALKGYLSKIVGKQYSTEITLEHLTQQPITISGVLSSNSGNDGSIRYDTDLSVDAGTLKTYAKGYVQTGNSNIAIKGTADYRQNNGPKHSVAFAAKLREGTVANNKILSGNVDFQCLLHPEYNWAVNLDSQRTTGHLESTLAVVYGDSKNADFNKLSFQHKYNRQGSLPEHRIVSITKVSFPPANIDASAELRSELNKKHLETVLALHYNKDKQMTLTVVGNKGEEGQQELVQGFAKISLPERSMKLSGDVRRNDDNGYSATVAGNWMDGEDAKIVFTMKNKSSGPFNREVSAVISLPGQEPITLSADVLLNDFHNRIRGEATMNGQNYKTYVDCLKPTLENFRISAGAILPTETYSAAAELSTIENERSLKTDLKFGDLQHLTSDFRVKRDGDHVQASAELNTDVDSSEKKYRLHLTHKQPALGSEGQIRLECPDQNMGVRWNVNRDAPRRHRPLALKGTYEIWWNNSEKLTLDVDTSIILSGTSRDISAKFLLHTPFHGVEQIGFQCSHNDDKHVWKNNALVTLYGESIAAIYTEGKVAFSEHANRLRANVKVETPLPLLPTLNFNVDLKQTGQQFDSDVQFKWSQHEQMEFNVHGNFDGTNLNGGVNISTPFPYMKDLSLSGDLLRQDKTTGQMRFSWNDRIFQVDIEGNGNVLDKKIDAYTKIHVLTPINQWEDIMTSLRFSTDRSNILASVELSLNNEERIALEVNVAHNKPTMTLSSDVLSLHFVSPFKPCEDVLITLTRETGQDHIRNQVELKYEPQNEYMAGFEMSIPSENNVHVKVEAKESYGIFDNLLVEVHYVLERNELKYKANAVWKDQSVDLEATLQKIGNANSETYKGIFRVDIPVLSVRNAQAQFEHKIENAVRDTQVQVDFGKQQVTLGHRINYKDALNFENSLQLTTPYYDISMNNKQRSTRGAFNHNSELNINKGSIYSVVAKYQVGRGNENQAAFSYASPVWQLSIAAIHDVSSATSRLTLEYSPDNRYELTSKFAQNSNNGEVQLTLTTPVDGFQELTIVGNYEQSTQEKSAKFSMKLTESIYARAQFTHKLNGRNFNTELIVNTPIARYETSSANVQVNLNDEPQSASVAVNFGGKAYKAAGQYTIQKPGQGQYELTLEIPVQNIETVKLIAKHEFQSPDKSISIECDTNFGRYELTAFHNKRSNSIDSGLALTSPINGYERLTLASHYDQVGSEMKTLLSFEKPNYKMELSSLCNIKPKDAHVNFVFTSPISGLESMTLDGRYAKSENVESATITMAKNDQSITFGINDSGDVTKRQMTISIKTPFEGVRNTKFIAEYNLEKMPATGSLTVMENDQHADLECSVDIQSNTIDFTVGFASPIKQMKSFKVKGNYKKESELVSGVLVFAKDNEKIETQITATLNNELRGYTNFVLKTPFEGYEHSEVYVEFDGTTDSKEVTVHIRRDEQRFDFNGQLNLGGNTNEVSVSANTTVRGYETMSASLTIDGSNNSKKVHTLTLNKGEETYQAKWELVFGAGHMESNLKLKTPNEDALLYGQYNLNGANAITFDIKAIKHRTMMELGGRLWRDPQLLKAEGSLVFNTNLMQMIAFTLSGRYNLVGAEKEFVLQSECNGERNTIQGKLSKSNDVLKVSIDGSSTIVPNMKTFALDGTIDFSNSEKQTKVTLTRNNDKVEITGNFVSRVGSMEGSLKATTSFAGYESLEVKMSTKYSPEKILTLTIRGNNKHLEFSFTHLVDGRKHVLNGSLQSSIQGWETAQAYVTVDGSGNDLKISTGANVEDKTVKANLVGFAKETSGNIRLSWSSNLLSIGEDNSIEATYDTVSKNALGKMTSNGQNLYSFEVNAEEAGKIVMRINTPFTKTLTFSCEHKVNGNNNVLSCSLTQETQNLFSMSLDIMPMASRLDVNGNIFSDTITLSFNYNLQNQQKTVSANYNKGNAHFEFDGTMTLSSTEHESTFSMKTSVPGFESLKYEARYDSKNSNLEALLQLRDNEQFKLTFSLPEHNRLKITLASPFKDYENMQFVVQKYDKDSTRHFVMEFEWQNKKMSFSAVSKKGALSFILSSPFEGFDSVAIHLTFSEKPVRVMLLLHIAPDQKYQAVAVADLHPKKSRWTLSLTTPIASHESYTFNGYTDFETDAKAGLMLEGRGQQIVAKFDAKKEEGGRSVEVSITTPFNNMEKLSLGGSYGTINNERKAQIQVNVNGNKLLIGSNLVREKNGFNGGLQIDSIATGVINIDVHGKNTKENLEFNINVKDDSSEKLLSFAILAEHIQLKSLSASVQLSSVIQLIPTCGIKANYVRNGETHTATFTAHFNDVNVIQANAEAKPGDATFNLNCQIYPLGHTHAKVHVYNRADHRGLTSLLNMEKTGKMSFDVEMKHPHPRDVVINAKLRTPFEVIPEMTSTVTLQSSSNNLNFEAMLKTPFVNLPRATLTIQANRSTNRKDNLLQLQLEGSTYTLRRSLIQEPNGYVDSTIVIETPIPNYEVITLSGKGQNNDKSGRQMQLQLSTPNTKTTLDVMAVSQSGNHELQVDLDSTFINFGPLNLKGKYVNMQQENGLALNFKTSQTEHGLTWNQDVKDQATNGKLSVHCTSSASKTKSWSVDYSVAIPTAVQPQYVLSINSVYDGNHKCSSSLKLAMDRLYRSFEGNLQMISDNSEHTIAADYKIGSPIFKSQFAIKSQLLPCKFLSGEVNVNNQDTNVLFTIGNVKNIFTSKYRAMSSKSYDVQMQVDMPSLSITEATLNGKLLVDEDVANGEVTFEHPDFTAAGMFRRSPQDLDAVIKIKHPDQNIGTVTITAHLIGKTYRKVDGQFSLTTAASKMAITAKWDVDHLNGDFIYSVDDVQQLAVEATFSRNGENHIEGHLTIKCGDKTHHAQLQWKRGQPESNFDFQVKTPLMGIDSLAIQSRLLQDRNRYVDGSFSMISPRSNHRFAAKLQNDDQSKQVELMANSPYFGSSAYTLTGKVSRENSKVAVIVVLSSPTDTHTLQIGFYRAENNPVFEAKLETPLFNIKKVTLTIQFSKLTTDEINAVCTLATSQATHNLAFNVKVTEGSIESHFNLNTPTFGLGTITGNLQLTLVRKSNLQVNLSFERGTQRYSVKASIHKINGGFQYHAGVTTPSTEDFETSGKLYRNESEGINIEGSVKTPSNEHHFEAHLLGTNEGFNGQVKIDSPLISCKTFTIRGNVNSMTPSNMDGDIAIETPGKNFKLQTNYRNTDEHQTEAGFLLTTPFESLPVLKFNGRLKRDADINGRAELYTSHDEQPAFSMNIYTQKDHHRRSMSLTIGTSTPGYEHFETSYYCGVEDDGIRTKLTFHTNNYAYGWNSKLVRTDNLQQVYLELVLANEKYVFETKAERLSNGIEVNFNTETPIWQKLGYKLQYETNERKHNFLTVLSGNNFEHSVNGKVQFTDNMNFNGRFDVKTTSAGFEKLSSNFQQTYKSGYLHFTLEQLSDGKPIFNVLVENNHYNGKGNGKFVLSTPFGVMKNTNAFYNYDKVQNDATGNVGFNYNGQKLLEISAASKDGTKVVEIINPIQPISAEYTYVNNGDTIKISGEYCWDNEHKKDSSIGFNAQVINTNAGKKLVIRTIHPTRPVTITFVTERTNENFVHSGDFAWGSDSSRSARYLISTVRRIESEQISYETKSLLVLPFRTFEMKTENVKTNSLNSRSIIFKWDAGHNDNKYIGMKYEHHDLSNNQQLSHRVQLSLQHNKLEKDLTLSGELAMNVQKEVVFYNRLELDYSRNEDQKFSIETKIIDNSESMDNSRYSLHVNVQHLASNTDLSLFSDLVNNSQEMSGGIQLSYLDNYGNRKNHELQSKILKLHNQIQILMESQANKLELSGQLKNLQHGYLLHLESKVNGKAPYTADLQLDREEGHKAELKVVYNPDKKSTMMMRTAMPDKKTISMNVYRQENENTINDIEFLVNLNNSRELVTKFHWRPNALQDVEASLPNMVRSLCSTTRNILQELSDSLSLTLNKKYHTLRISLENSISPAVEDVNNEMSRLKSDAQEMIKVLQQAYRDNTFYIRNIYDTVAPFQICKHACKFLMNSVSAISDATISVIEAFSDAISGIKNICQYVCENFFKSIRGRINDIPHAIVHHANQLHAVSRRVLSHVVLQTLRTFKEMTVYIVHVAGGLKGVTPEWVHHVSNDVTVKLQGYFDQFFVSTYYQQLKQGIDQLISALQDVYNHAFWEKLWMSYSDKLQRMAEYTSNNPYMQNICKLTEGIYEMGVWAYEFLNVESLARDMLNVVMSRAEHIALHVLQEMILPELHLPSMEQSIMFKPENGQLEIRQQLPVPWNSFYEYPQIQGTPVHEEFIRFKSNVNRLPKLALHNFKNAWNSEFKWDSVVPSLRGRALLVGNQHYVTFDNRAYEFAGECSYLLARDFLDNNFTAIVNYERDGEKVARRSLLFILDGHHIEISSDMKVAIDGALTELPASIGSTRLSHLGKVLSLDNDARQVWMKCDTAYNACLLEIGAFYHGKTGGLFGTFDHEPYNDFMTPEQKKIEDLEAFTKSWEVGNGKCQSHKNNAYKEEYKSYKVQKQCDDLFGGYNSLRSCLRKVNPSSYMNMCLNDASEGTGPCSAAAAYVMMCRANGVSVSLPDSCLECDVAGKTVQQGDEIVVEGSDIQQSVDVVFVVDNSWQCSTTFPNLRSTVSTIARNFEGAFDSVSITNNRYAVVGFGVGAPNHPQVITADGQTFGPLRSLDSALNNTHFAAGHHHHISDLIRYGVDLPFRVGVSKVFVVVPCAEADETIETATFKNLMTELSNMDATLHLISIREPVLNSDKIKASDILGYDSKTAYTLKSVQRGVLVGDKDARQQIVPQKTMMTDLVFHTNGSIFLANRLGSVQPKISKVANEVFARRVALRASPPSCQNCMCTVSTDGSPKVICSKCSTGDVIETVFPKDDFKKMNSSKAKNNHLMKDHGRRSGLKRVLEEKTRYHKV